MKSYRYLILAILVSLLPLVSVFSTSDLPHTHDGASHLPRMAAYYKALADGQILPRWAGDLNFGYGLPLFNFIYHTPYLLASLFIKLGASLVLSFKLLMLFSFLLSAVSMFAFAKKLFKDDKPALLVTLFYQFSPFRLVEMMVRGSLGEMFSYAFAPLVLYGLVTLFEQPRIPYFVITAIATFFLVISHNSISLVFFAACCLFVIFFAQSRKNIFFGFMSLTLGLASSAFYWIPALMEHKYTYGDLFMKDMYLAHFPPIQQFIIPNVFNSASLQTGGIAVQIGFFHLLAILLSCFILLSKKNISSVLQRLLLLSLMLTGISIFFMTNISMVFWERISFLRQFQFPWRLLALVSLSGAMAAAGFMSFSFWRKPITYWSLLYIMVFTTAFFWKPPLGFDKVTDEKKDYWNYPLNTTYFGETDVIWSAGPEKEYPKSPVESIEGQATIMNYSKRSNIHTYQVSAIGNVKLVDHTQYFPGWRVYVDNKKTPAEFQDVNWRGQITFPVSTGKHTVKVIFEKSLIQYLSELISYITLITLGIMFVFTGINPDFFHNRYSSVMKILKSNLVRKIR